MHENRVSLARESALQQLPQKQAFKINDSLLHTQSQLQYFEGLCQLVCQGVGTPYCHWSQCSATKPPPAWWPCRCRVTGRSASCCRLRSLSNSQ